jgi:hypothetical protein
VTGRLNDDRRPLLHLQAKRELRISAARSNVEFRAVVGAAWDTLVAAIFQDGVDRIGAVTEYVSLKRYRAVRLLGQAARYANSGAELRERFDAGLYGRDAREVAQAVTTQLQDKIGRLPTDQEIWRFWRHFIVVRIEMSGEAAPERHQSIQQLKARLPEHEQHRAQDLFEALEVIARDMCATAGSVDRPLLMERLGGRFTLSEQEAQSPHLPVETAAGKYAALQDLRASESQQPTMLVELDLELTTGDRTEQVDHRGAVTAFKPGGLFVLEADPGAGKSTTLLQLARLTLSETIDRVPVVVVLARYAGVPEVSGPSRGIIEDLASRPPFHDLGIAGLRHLAEAGRLVLFCDGWNELSGAQRTSVRRELETFRQYFPKTTLVIATRALSPLPFKPTSKIHISPLTHSQQLAILAAMIGSGATDFFMRIRRAHGLRDVLRIPLYLNAVAAVGAQGVLPATKEEIVRRFVGSINIEHRDALARALIGTEERYLKELAAHLMAAQQVAIPQSEVRRIFDETTDRLAAERQKRTQHEPRIVIDLLVAHHLLIEVDGGGTSLIGFQHQQFQEWFASFHAEDLMRAATQRPNSETRTALDALIDSPAWEEPLLFAVERMAHAGEDDMRAVACTILRTLGIDPLLGASMIRRAPPAVWELVSEPTLSFAHSWAASAEGTRATSFMIATGRAEFSEQVWSFLEDKGRYGHAALLSHGFPPSVLGSNWRARFPNLPPERRRSLLWDLVRSGDQDGVDFAIEAARADSSPDVVLGVLQLIEDEASGAQIASLLDNASREIWETLARRRPLADANPAIQPRLAEEKKKLVTILPQSVERLRLLMELDEDAEVSDPDTVIEEALAVKFEDHHAEYSIFSQLSSRYPQKLSSAVLERLTKGLPLPRYADEFATSLGSTDQEAVRLTVLSGNHRAKRVAARLLDVVSCKQLIDELLDAQEGWQGRSYLESKALHDKFSGLSDVLHLAPISALASAVLNTRTDQPRSICAVATLLLRWQDDDRERTTLPIDVSLADALSRRAAEWVQQIADHAEARGHHFYPIALVVARIGKPELLPLLTRLLDADMERWRREQAEWDKLPRQARRSSPSHPEKPAVHMYRQAFDALEGEAVRDALLGYLDDPDFAIEAALALRRYGASEKLVIEAPIGRPKYEQVAEARLTRPSRQRAASNPVAAAILDRVDKHLAAGDAQSISLANGLAHAAAQMDYGDRWETFQGVLTAPAPMSARYALLRCLLFKGETIRTEWVRAGLDEALPQLAGGYSEIDRNWWQVERWLELLAFTGSPQAVLEFIEKLPADAKQTYRLNGVIFALGHVRSEAALETLIGLGRQTPEIITEYGWLTAVAQIGSQAAAEHLIGLLFDPATAGLLHREEYIFAKVVSPLLRQHPTVRSALLERMKADMPLVARGVVARLLPEIADEDSIVGLLGIADLDERNPLTHGIIRAVEELAVAKRPIEDTTAYEQEPAELRSLRARLLTTVRSASDTSQLARRLLIAIDKQRDMYGRPISEPRHPDLSTEMPWPPEAAVAWNALPSFPEHQETEPLAPQSGGCQHESPQSAGQSSKRGVLFDALVLRPSVFGVGIDLKPLLASVVRVFRKLKKNNKIT